MKEASLRGCEIVAIIEGFYHQADRSFCGLLPEQRMAFLPGPASVSLQNGVILDVVAICGAGTGGGELVQGEAIIRPAQGQRLG